MSNSSQQVVTLIVGLKNAGLDLDSMCTKFKKSLKGKVQVKRDHNFKNSVFGDCIEVAGDVTGMMVQELAKFQIEKHQVTLL